MLIIICYYILSASLHSTSIFVLILYVGSCGYYPEDFVRGVVHRILSIYRYATGGLSDWLRRHLQECVEFFMRGSFTCREDFEMSAILEGMWVSKRLKWKVTIQRSIKLVSCYARCFGSLIHYTQPVPGLDKFSFAICPLHLWHMTFSMAFCLWKFPEHIPNIYKYIYIYCINFNGNMCKPYAWSIVRQARFSWSMKRLLYSAPQAHAASD